MGLLRIRRRAAAVLVLACLLAGGRAGAQPAAPTDDTTFQIVTMTQDGPRLHSVELGTAFFIDADGTALTNSHVVHLAWQDPAHYQLLAIVGREFYSARLVCAAPLPYDPARDRPVFGRDVAEVKLGPSRFPFTQLVYNGGLEYTAHVTAPPPFPALVLGDDPSPGIAVWIIGYGLGQEQFPPTPGEAWTTTGTVDRVARASDGTTVFRIMSPNRPRRGDSGSPVLDGWGRVVGMWTWNETDNSAYGEAIGGSALKRPCETGRVGRSAPVVSSALH
jgi:hypothetical protein